MTQLAVVKKHLSAWMVIQNKTCILTIFLLAMHLLGSCAIVISSLVEISFEKLILTPNFLMVVYFSKSNSEYNDVLCRTMINTVNFIVH